MNIQALSCFLLKCQVMTPPHSWFHLEISMYYAQHFSDDIPPLIEFPTRRASSISDPFRQILLFSDRNLKIPLSNSLLGRRQRFTPVKKVLLYRKPIWPLGKAQRPSSTTVPWDPGLLTMRFPPSELKNKEKRKEEKKKEKKRFLLALCVFPDRSSKRHCSALIFPLNVAKQMEDNKNPRNFLAADNRYKFYDNRFERRPRRMWNPQITPKMGKLDENEI